MFKNWWIFAKERFPLGSHLLMVAAFCMGNWALARHVSVARGFGDFPFTENSDKALLLCLLALLFFFRLRVFDEIKDYEVDLKVNPTRPLVRGVVSLRDAKKAIFWVLVGELGLCYWLNGIVGISFHLPAVAYSFLMYREFFIGQFIRPHLTTYAVLHTYVSVLLGFSVSLQLIGAKGLTLPLESFLFLLVNWGFFNLFEFARKTFSPQEERDGVESYSKVFSLPGAVLLSLIQVLFPLMLLMKLGFFGELDFAFYTLSSVAGALTFFTGLLFVFKKNTESAKLFRLGVSLYLITGYMGLAWVLNN